MKNKIIIVAVSLILFCGCSDPVLNKARQYQRESDKYFQKSEKLYKKVVKKSKRKEPAYELGKLYLEKGRFYEAIDVLEKSAHQDAGSLLALAYYRVGDYTAALEYFSRNKSNNDECLYFYAMTSEKFNLFDQAIEIYKKVRDKNFIQLAQNRISEIEKKNLPKHIKDVSAQVDKIITAAPGNSEYPQASILYLLSEENIEVTRDNKEISSMHYVIKILNERGKENASEAAIEYDSTFEKVDLEYARTVKPDGSVVEVGSKHIRDVTKYMNFPLYSNVKIFIISFPEIAVGSVIEYKVKVTGNKLINDKHFISLYAVQNDEPVLSADFNVKLPKDRQLNLKQANIEYNNFSAKLEPDIIADKDAVVYNWKFKNIPQIIPEVAMPSASKIDPMVIMSTFGSWQEIYGWWWNLAKDKITADNNIKSKVSELTEGIVTLEDKVKAIYNFCAKDIRYVAVEYGQAGYEPHQAVDIFDNKYGDCKDQAILLVTMLKQIGVSSWPVLIATQEHLDLDEKFPNVMFNHCIAVVELNGQLVFMDPTAQTCSFGDLPVGDQGRKVLIIKEDSYSIAVTPEFGPAHNRSQQKMMIRINEDESIKAHKEVFTFGAQDQSQRYWLLYTMPDLVKQYLEKKIQTVSIGSKLIDYQTLNLDDLNIPVELLYNFEGPEYFIKAGNLRILPQLSSYIGMDSVAKEKRVYPIEYNNKDSEEVLVEIKLPDQFMVKHLPDDINIDNKWYTIETKYEFDNRNAIVYQERIELKETFITQNEYSAYKRFLENLAKQMKQRVVLEVKSEYRKTQK